MIEEGRERLTSRQNEHVRRVGREVLRERFDQNGTRMAASIGITQPNLSRFLNGKQGTTRDAALKILALGGVEPAHVGLDSPSSEVLFRIPSVSHHPEWQNAEAEARRLYKRIPEDAWASARRFSYHGTVHHITPEFVMHLALAAYDISPSEPMVAAGLLGFPGCRQAHGKVIKRGPKAKRSAGGAGHFAFWMALKLGFFKRIIRGWRASRNQF